MTTISNHACENVSMLRFSDLQPFSLRQQFACLGVRCAATHSPNTFSWQPERDRARSAFRANQDGNGVDGRAAYERGSVAPKL